MSHAYIRMHTYYGGQMFHSVLFNLSGKWTLRQYFPLARTPSLIMYEVSSLIGHSKFRS